MDHDLPLHCPKCGSDMDAGEIPEAIREHYSPPYRFRRLISVQDRDRDRHDHWQCPDCGHEWK